MITKDMAENAAIWLGWAVFFGLLTIAPKSPKFLEEVAPIWVILGALLAAICAAAGFGFGVHRTDHAPETALLSLYTALGLR